MKTVELSKELRYDHYLIKFNLAVHDLSFDYEYAGVKGTCHELDFDPVDFRVIDLITNKDITNNISEDLDNEIYDEINTFINENYHDLEDEYKQELKYEDYD